MNKLLVVYNTCGLRRENNAFYIKAIRSILQQDFEGMKVVVSMYKNSLNCKKDLAKEFGNKISYVFYDHDTLGVNSTFNKTVQLCVEKYGKYNGYLYLDSGVILERIDGGNSKNIFENIYNTFLSGPFAMTTIQVNHDSGFNHIGLKYSSNEVQIKNEHFLMPLGKAVNLHSQIFSHDLFEAYKCKILPDVFAAYCSESVLSFLNAAIHKKWIIAKDISIHHLPSMEGASASFSHHSWKHKNTWNNLLFERDALDFINDPEAIDAGLGYEECGNIMMHKEDAYDENGYAKHPEKLREVINKYLFLSEKELDYNKIKYKSIWN